MKMREDEVEGEIDLDMFSEEDRNLSDEDLDVKIVEEFARLKEISDGMKTKVDRLRMLYTVKGLANSISSFIELRNLLENVDFEDEDEDELENVG